MVMPSGEDTPLVEHVPFRERLAQLEAAIPDAAIHLRPMLSCIHRSAIRLHDQLQRIDCTPPLPRTVVSQIRCFDCGKGNLESFHSSPQGGYHLCPPCFQQRLRTGRAKSAH